MRGLMRGRLQTGVLAIALIVAATVALGSVKFSLSPIAFLKQAIRVVATPVLQVIYRGDMQYVEEATKRYSVGARAFPGESAEESWRRVEAAVPGLKIIGGSGFKGEVLSVPFVYEKPDVEYLRNFRVTHRLEDVIRGAHSEYDAMLQLARWVGTRWDHGTDEVPGGSQVCDPSAVVRAGERGAKFWCEIAARTMVHAATSLGWQARVVTASRDGYTWEHAVAELWSNRFGKWFVIDTDFNVVFERDGVPLSAFELVHDGESLQATNRLTVVTFAPPKRSLPGRDLIPFFAYAHVDMRNDWCSRRLGRGSPAGGDVATWWTARDTFGPLLTARKRVDSPQQFDWPVNVATMRAAEGRRLGRDKVEIDLELTGYGPEVESIEVAFDGGAWSRLEGSSLHLSLSPGRHELAARVANRSGSKGPTTSLALDIGP